MKWYEIWSRQKGRVLNNFELYQKLVGVTQHLLE